MLYKPNWWKDYFNPEQVHLQSSILPVRDSTIFWDIPASNQIDEGMCEVFFFFFNLYK